MYSYHLFRYLLRDKTNKIEAKYYSIVEKEEDIILSKTETTNWNKMKVVSVSEFKKEIFNRYDYLVLYKCNDNFKNSYKSLFENYNDIHQISTYIIDNKKEKLILKKS